jgi:hypothetical protein
MAREDTARLRARARRKSLAVAVARWCLLLLAGWPGSALGGASGPGAAIPKTRGFAYFREDLPKGPWAIHVIKIDRSNPDFELHTTLGGGARIGMANLSEQIRQMPPQLGRPVAAVNGDFYRNDAPYAGDPKGLQIMRGELVSAPCGWSCFWIDPAGQPQITNVASRFEVAWPNGTRLPVGLNEERAAAAAVLYTAAAGSSTHTSGGVEWILEAAGSGPWLPLGASQTYAARVREVRRQGNAPLSADTLVLSLGPQAAAKAPEAPPGTLLAVSTQTHPALNGVRTALSGGPVLVRGGQPVAGLDAGVRHPRTAVGWNQEYLFLVEVDGRQINLSVGMTWRELADYLVKLGCQEGVNLDGGGSATCWVYGQIMNNPSEGRERPMANALVLVRKNGQEARHGNPAVPAALPNDAHPPPAK